MPRDIRFRAWDKKEQKILPVGELHFIMSGDWSLNSVGIKGLSKISLRSRYLEQIELMQCTGLKDKNGKEIYEGDVCELRRNAERIRVQVLWKDACWWFWNEDELTIEFAAFVNRAEVIGNIYENPELIK